MHRAAGAAGPGLKGGGNRVEADKEPVPPAITTEISAGPRSGTRRRGHGYSDAILGAMPPWQTLREERQLREKEECRASKVHDDLSGPGFQGLDKSYWWQQ
ncbi:hypothetical protein NDU88_002833 [Pleurodeles waltl]|uniref:Uncharacterized protein n=1 Tax=Pleurodeles waltl TaxID=8319 RepID=A0AAV7UAS2_PLEWA|nr:hypothetical protein NDU88_002833 [Pleurodeles waltl]